MIFLWPGVRHEKSKKIHDLYIFVEAVFKLFFCCFLGHLGAAGAGAHLEKTGFRVEGVALFACRPFPRGSEESKACNENHVQQIP